MFAQVWRRGRMAAVIGVSTAVVAAGVAGTVGVAGAATAQTAQTARASVPWSKVGPGWALVQYASGSSANLTTLYLAAPTGAKYALRTTRDEQARLIAWSGDRTRALFLNVTAGDVEQLNLMTGKLTRFAMGRQTLPVGYTLPDGLNIFAISDGSGLSPSFILARYNLAGKLQKVLVHSKWAFDALYAPNGATLAIPNSTGLALVSNAGGVIRPLHVPTADPSIGCTPERWWNAGTILAACTAKNTAAPRLWLVPASGAKATALTPQRTGTYDLGDVDAWQLKSGLYLQSFGACGTIELNKQGKGGKVTPVKVPGTANNHNVVVTAAGPRLLLDAGDACNAGAGLVWFNPSTNAEQWMFKFSAHAGLTVVPFSSLDNASGL